MFVYVIMTSLITFLVLFLSMAAYLLSVIMDNSDDDPSAITLGLDTDDFTRTPATSPTQLINGSVENMDELRQTGASCNCLGAVESGQRRSFKSAAAQTIEAGGQSHEPGADPQLLQGAALLAGAAAAGAEPEEIRSAEMNSRLLKACESQREPAEIALKSDSGLAEDHAQVDAGISSWHSSASAQKSIISSHLGAAASKQIFDDFDIKEMQLGGTALHWCKTRKSLDRLLRLGLPLDIVNKRHETALHVAIRQHKLQILIGLLNHGANLESRNDNGETPLILACRVNDIFATQLLLIYDADFDATDNLNQSSRHHSARICDRHTVKQQLPSAAHLILAMLNEIGAKRCAADVQQQTIPIAGATNPATSSGAGVKVRSACTDGCSHVGTYNGNSYSRWPNFERESSYKRYMSSDIIESKRRELRSGKRQSPNSRLLCMDGGGLRGVIICQIMIEMEKYLKRPMLSYFDWVGGTSVGAFIACALCLGSSLREMRRICFEFKDEVFTGARPYNSKFLERVLKRTLGAKTRLSEIKGTRLAFATVLADRDPCQLKIFRNYNSATHLLEAHGFSVDHYSSMSGHTAVPTNSRRHIVQRISGQMRPDGTVSRELPTNVADRQSGKEGVEASEANNLHKDQQENKSKAEQGQAKEETTSSGGGIISKSDDDSSKETTDAKAEQATTRAKEAAESILDENDGDPIVWQAVRASAAAPFFFKPYGPYLDGGIISNNPTLDMLTEFINYQRARDFIKRHGGSSSVRAECVPESKERLDLVVSLGTGRGRVIGRQAMSDFGQITSSLAAVFSPVELARSIRAARDLFKRLMQQTCHADDHILDRAQAWCSSLEIPYFRLNPPLATIFSIDDKRDEQLINALWQTKLYMLLMKDQLVELAELMDGGPAQCESGHLQGLY